jgi:hypothetical protein
MFDMLAGLRAMCSLFRESTIGARAPGPLTSILVVFRLRVASAT